MTSKMKDGNQPPLCNVCLNKHGHEVPMVLGIVISPLLPEPTLAWTCHGREKIQHGWNYAPFKRDPAQHEPPTLFHDLVSSPWERRKATTEEQEGAMSYDYQGESDAVS